MVVSEHMFVSSAVIDAEFFSKTFFSLSYWVFVTLACDDRLADDPELSHQNNLCCTFSVAFSCELTL